MRSANPPAALNRLAGYIRTVPGWRRALIACAAGMASTLALPPIHLLPFLFVAFIAFVWLIEGSRSPRGAFAIGWWFGFGQFTSGLYWIAYALLVDAAQFGWMVPFAVGGLAAGLAIFTGLTALLARLGGREGAPLVGALAASWTAMEWLRGTILTGFPWNLMASAWVDTPAMQAGSVLGAYGLSLITVAIAAAPATLAGETRRWRVTALAGIALVALQGGGWVRLMGTEDGFVPGVRLRVVQGNVAQAMKWQPEQAEASFLRYLRLSAAPSAPAITHLVWPETAVPFLLSADPARRAAIGAVVPPGGLALIGALRAEIADGRIQRVWNSLQALNGDGGVVAVYDKFHLVPFGEYMPFRAYLSGFNFIPGTLDFSTGPGLTTLDLPGLPPAGPLICYEVIFPGHVVNGARRPAWLINVTNDAWFGYSTGPYQHLASARMRAVEEGLPLVRAANTGISAVIDPYGRVVASLGLDREGVIDSQLPLALTRPTFFAYYGNWMAGILVVVMGLLAAFSGVRRRI